MCQALERGEAQLVILAEDCDHEDYVKLVTALTAEKGVYLIKVPEKAKLGDWAGAIVPTHAASKINFSSATLTCCIYA